MLRSRVFSDFIKRRTDATQKKVIERYAEELEFDPVDKLMIGPAVAGLSQARHAHGWQTGISNEDAL